MAIRSQSQIARVTVDALNFQNGIEILAGNTVQNYYTSSQEYVPLRALEPLILMPYVNVIDPSNVMDGAQSFTNIEWYEGVPQGNKSNQITASTEHYEIGNGTVEGFPKFALKVKKDVPPDEPLQISCIAYFTDKRLNETRSVMAAIVLRTNIYDAVHYVVKVDKPQNSIVDPLKIENLNTSWDQVITAQLYAGYKPVDDANSAYWWDIMDEGEYRAVGSKEEDDLWITCKDENGVYTKTLTFDARMVKNASFRVRATYYEDERPSAPASGAVQYSFTYKISVSATVDMTTRLLKGAKIKPGMTDPISYSADLYYNKAYLTDEQYQLFQIKWVGKSSKAGSSEKILGYGRIIDFIPAEHFDASYPFELRAEAYVYGYFEPVTDNNGVFITDSNNKFLMTPKFD